MSDKTKKPFYKKWWFIVIVVIIVLAVIGAGAGSDDPTDTQTSTSTDQTQDVQDTPTAEPEEKIPSEYRSALNKAESYSEIMHMSKAGIYDQLVSEYGEKFSKEAAQYAIDNMEAYWNANALEKAKEYRDAMDMSPAAIYDQLISDYGEKFTKKQAQYAIDNLD